MNTKLLLQQFPPLIREFTAVKPKRPLLCFGVTLALVMFALVVLAKPARPPVASEVAGVWSGYGDQVEFLRLELDTNGTGYLCVSYLPDAPARLYRVERWIVSNWMVDLQTRPMDAEAEPITFRKIRYSWVSLDGEFGGRGWKRQIKLFNEREWLSRSAPTQERIAKYRNE